MLLDNQLMFSDAQNLTATAVSTNVIDMGVARDLGAGELVILLFQFGTVTSNATWNAALKGADDSGITSNVLTKTTTPTITPVSNTIYPWKIPSGVPKRFWRVDYTMAGGSSPAIPTTTTIVKDVEVKPHSKSYN